MFQQEFALKHCCIQAIGRAAICPHQLIKTESTKSSIRMENLVVHVESLEEKTIENVHEIASTLAVCKLKA